MYIYMPFRNHCEGNTSRTTWLSKELKTTYGLVSKWYRKVCVYSDMNSNFVANQNAPLFNGTVQPGKFV